MDEIRKFDLPLGGWINGWYICISTGHDVSGTRYRIDE